VPNLSYRKATSRLLILTVTSRQFESDGPIGQSIDFVALGHDSPRSVRSGATVGNQPSDIQAGIALAADQYQPGEQANGGQNKARPVVLTPGVKQMIGGEVKAVIAEEQRAAGSQSASLQSGSGDELPAVLDRNHRVFVVLSVLEVTVDSETYSLASSDVVKRIEDAPDKENTVAVQILASKASDCMMGSRVRVPLTDLNDLLNYLREQVDVGLKVLSGK
jgi:hypothetical protein